MQNTLLSLLALYPPIYRSRGGGSASPLELLCLVGFLLSFLLVPLLLESIARARRARLVERAMTLPRKASPGVNCIVSVKVTRGDTQVDPMWERPAVWFELTLTASNPPPGETAPVPLTVTHHGRCELSADDGILDVDMRRVSMVSIRETDIRSATPEQLPSSLRALLRERSAPVLWKTGRTVQWSVRASAVHLDDELMVIGRTERSPEAVTHERDTSEGGAYRDAPLRDPRPVWKVVSGPGRDGLPVLAFAIPETLAMVLEGRADDLDARWFGVD